MAVLAGRGCFHEPEVENSDVFEDFAGVEAGKRALVG